MRIGFDFDGVVCATPFGRFAVHAPGPVEDLPPSYELLYDAPHSVSPLRGLIEYLRFGWRAAVPGAPEIVREMAGKHQLYVVTGRSVAGERLLLRWLTRNRLDRAFSGVRMAPPGLRSAQHKLATARMIGIDAHIDDDPRTAYHLAENGVPRVYLYDHAGAHGEAQLPRGLTLVRSLREFADVMRDSS
jgi:hypothetical protein